MSQAGSAVWFARHESRLAWRDFVAMMTAGRRTRARKVAIGFVVFVIIMHVIAYSVVGRYADAPIDRQLLIGVSASLLLSWLLMISQAMESMTRAFYARADLDLILASPVAAERLFAVRIGTVALSVAGMALPLAGPFIDMLVWRGGAHWLGAYGIIPAMGATAAALAVLATAALFRLIGPKRTRFIAQIIAAVIGAAFVIGLQVAAILSYGTLSQGSVLQSDAFTALLPAADSVVWWPARAVLGDARALIVLLALGFAVLAGAIAIVAPRFGAYAVAAASAESAPSTRAQRPSALRAASPRRALRRKEWILLRRDPWLVSQTLMQMLYLLPPALMLWKSFAAQSPGGALNLLVPVLVMAAGQLAGGLAWLTISGEDAPDLVATAPIPARFVLRAKIEAVLGVIAVVFAPLIAVLAFASLRHALLTLAGIVAASASATAIQLWFRTQAKRSQFRRRQVSSRVATFAEAFSSIAFAATAAIAAISVPLAIAPGIAALIVVGGARYLSPRKP
jgi:ABC-2 type transport system permease protein